MADRLRGTENSGGRAWLARTPIQIEDEQPKSAPRRFAGIDTPEPLTFVDRLEAALADAPIDDEPLTDEDRAAIEAGWEDYRQGQTNTLDELLERNLRPAGSSATGRTSASRP